ncbi:MAG: hypothetical protein ABI618_06130 [Nitrospirota bacterium]
MLKRGIWFFLGFLNVISKSVLGIGAPTWSGSRIEPGADIQADPENTIAIESTFIQTDSAMAKESLDALMQIYSENYRNKDLRKADIRKIW